MVLTICKLYIFKPRGVFLFKFSSRWSQSLTIVLYERLMHKSNYVDDLDADAAADAAADMELIWTLLSWQDNAE